MSSDNVNYFITTLTKPQITQQGPAQRANRCVGFLTCQDDAIEQVEKNAGDIYENGCYPICVIEGMSEGIYPTPVSTDWFEWDDTKAGYRKLSGPPEDLQGVLGFSIG